MGKATYSSNTNVIDLFWYTKLESPSRLYVEKFKSSTRFGALRLSSAAILVDAL